MASSTAKTQNPTSTVQETANQVVDKISEGVQDTVDKAKSYTADLAKQVERGLEQMPELIKQYPVQSLLVGFGLGFGAAFLASKLFLGKTAEPSV